MKIAQVLFGAVFALLIGAPAGAGVVGVTSISAGDNPFFPTTGGAGDVASFDPAAQNAVVEKDFTAIGDIPIIIDRSASLGVDLFHIDERVRNNTGTDWTDFHFVFEGIDNNPGLSISFLNVANPTGQWTSTATGSGYLSLFGLVPDGDIFSLSFDLQMDDEVGSYALFGIHEVPSVPEPATLALLGIGLAVVVAAGRRDVCA